MGELKQVKHSSKNMISQNARRKAADQFELSPNRCKNTFLVGKNDFKDTCNKRMLIAKGTGKEFCPQCQTVEKEDQQLAKETQELQEKAKIIKLFKDFEDGSLINQKLKKAMFQNYVPPSKQLTEAKEACEQYVRTFNKKVGKNIMLVGDYGTGKSHLAVAMTKELMRRGVSACFITEEKLFTKLKATYNRKSEMTEDELLTMLSKMDCLVIDDLGAEKEPDDEEELKKHKWAQKKLFEIIDSRIGRHTIYTTNHAVTALYGIYNERIFSRIFDDETEVIEMNGNNYRLRRFEKEQEIEF